MMRRSSVCEKRCSEVLTYSERRIKRLSASDKSKWTSNAKVSKPWKRKRRGLSAWRMNESGMKASCLRGS